MSHQTEQGTGAHPDGPSFHLFVYGTLMSAGEAIDLLEGCERVGTATVNGTLYDIDGDFPALMLAGNGQIHGEVWRCPVERLAELDGYEGVAQGLFRRVGVQADRWPCWTYVAGPKLAPRIARAKRIESGRW